MFTAHFYFLFVFFFFNDTATTEIYTLSLHDALPICCPRPDELTPAIPADCKIGTGRDAWPASPPPPGWLSAQVALGNRPGRRTSSPKDRSWERNGSGGPGTGR